MKTMLQAIFVMLLLTDASSGKDDIRFCSLAEFNVSESALRIDLGGRRMMGGDAASPLAIVENQFAVGFIGQFPLSLPKRRISASQVPRTWQVGGFRFTATSVNPADPDWLLIYAAAIPNRAERLATSSVLYSQSRGVIAIREVLFPEGKTIVQELYSCGTNSLSPSSFAGFR